MMSSNSSSEQKSGQTKTSWLSRRPKWLRWVTSILLVALLGAGGYFVVKARQTTAATSTTSTLQTATARTGNLVLQASGSGYLVASSEANIAFENDGKLSEIDVELGDKVEKGQLLARLDDASLQYKLEEAQLALLELTSPEAIANAELAVTTAQADVINAQTGLNNQEYWKNDALIQNEYAAFVIAKANLDRAQTAYDNAKVGEYINNANEAQAYQALYSAQQAYNTAHYYYSLYSQKPTERQLNAAQATLDLANAKLTNAQNYLKALTGGTVPTDATGSNMAALRQAQLDLKTAQTNLDSATLYAPMSGTVMTLSATVGENISKNTIIMTIDDLSQATIQFYLDAGDWTNAKVGYESSVSFDALTGQTFSGKVIEIMPGLVSVQGSSMIEGYALLDKSVDEIGLPVGVQAAIDVISGQATNAVLIPVEALHKLSDNSYTVFVMVNGKPKLTTVEVGLQDDTYAEIKSGLKAGDVVTTGVVETKQ
jgi:RND family efflux transporter MFP subunit